MHQANVARDGNIAIREEFDHAAEVNTVAAWQLFLDRHPLVAMAQAKTADARLQPSSPTQLYAGGGVRMMSASPAVVLDFAADIAMPVGQRDALCQSLHTALAAGVGADRLLPLSAADSPAAGALRITLRLIRADAWVIEGHLEWQIGGAVVVIGGPITLSADDMPLGPPLYPSFANGLLQVSKLPL
jgi:hypothetical protein